MVNDFAGKLSPATRQTLNRLLLDFRAKTGIEMAVATVPYDYLGQNSIDDYSLKMGRSWGIAAKGNKQGLLLLVAIKPPGPDGVYHGGTRLEVSRHLEGDIPDALAGYLIVKMRDDFMAGRFDQALTTGVQTILSTVAQRRGLSIDGVDSSYAYSPPVPVPTPPHPYTNLPSYGRGGGGISLVGLFIIVCVFILILRVFLGGGRGGGGFRRRGGFNSDWIIWPIIFGEIFGSTRRGSDWTNWGGGGGGFGGGDSGGGWSGGDSGGGWSGGGDSGGGGDFGGFSGGDSGGGDFGGGGASDSW